MKAEISESIANIKRLQANKKQLLIAVADKKRILEAAKKQENEVKEKYGKRSQRAVLHLVENVFVRHCISKPYYHGGKYNGKSMNRFMTCSQEIMDDLATMLQQLPAGNRCENTEIVEVTSKFKSILHVFDFIFSKARKQSGLVSENDLQELRDYIYIGMKLWRDLELSVEAPKPHAIEDHLCDQMHRWKGIGDLGEDWVEQAHQDGIKDEGRTRAIKNRNAAANLHCRWEHKRKLPPVTLKSEQVRQQAIRMKCITTDMGENSAIAVSKKGEKQQVVFEQKMAARSEAFATTTSSNGVFLTTGRKRNIEDYIRHICHARILINRQIRIMLAKVRSSRKRMPILIIQKQIRVLVAKIKLRRNQHATTLLSLF